MDIFELKSVKPMLIGVSSAPFNSADYIFELKLDGIRGIAYLDSTGTFLSNKRNMNCNPIYPELNDLHKYVNGKCILDGEYICVNSEGKPDFFAMQKRSLMTDSVKIAFAQKTSPVSFVAYDILYLDGKQLTTLPLMERKELLQTAVGGSDALSVSRYIEEKGTEFYNLTVEQELEGIVAKRKDSKYYFDKRTKDWIKIKYLQDDDFVVCGYIVQESNMSSIVLGQYDNGQLIYKGYVSLGASGTDYHTIKAQTSIPCPFNTIPSDSKPTIWVTPSLVCRVEFMHRTESGGMRQSVFKGLRNDKLPTDCTTMALA